MSVLLVTGEAETSGAWMHTIAAALPEERVVQPGPGLDRAGVTVAIVAAPPAGSLQDLPNLAFIQSLRAGVDGLMADPTVPAHVPVARLVDPALTAMMVESVLLHVLSLHRQMPAYRAFQAAGAWQFLAQKPAAERQVGVLGLGVLGQAACTALAGLGFVVSGWSRSPRQVAGIRCLHGDGGLEAVLASSEILVNLLPLTPRTEGILDARAFSQLPRGAGLINMAHRWHLVEADLLAALETGQIDHAVLDVLVVEPAPADHPFWRHERITLTPHVAAATDPASAAAIAAQAVRDLRAGRPIRNLVHRAQAY
ncbi:glyoxylate/hydroxypyruvate reductase A [Lichenicola cladoniae]|uniref:Glyoxylate/hydroxypyruvate reductase A n=1 Tax=Lichenicola cladoniae TaxID=1484109 RepID=A0A6M8GZM5_9PROT|nr:glyoxylate/hydroxypyruvate reductase A [Lichenicola cladoniae]NPD69220.1 glyoxylate/hydroxypyruvate reductase A [Acetobacteraceae bacterium]QKE89044.1 glyoxylate/hydroxypyruvate reductase A [Lichenicola cladoniae]